MSSSEASGTKSLISGERPSVRLPRRIGAHLGQRSDRLGEPAPDGEHAGNGGRADGPHADQHDPQFPCAFGDFYRIFHNSGLYHRYQTARAHATAVGAP